MTVGYAATARRRGTTRVDCRVIESWEELQPYERDWDRLAVKCGRPTSRPAWLRAWWEARCAPADGPSRALRVVLATEGETLVGVFPGFLVDGSSRFADLRVLGKGGFWSVGPVVTPHAAEHTLGLVARALSDTSPAPTRLMCGCVSSRDPWPRALRQGWPGGPAWLRRGYTGSLVVVEGQMSPAEWFAGLPKRRRTDLRRLSRRRAEAGVDLCFTENPDTLGDDVRALAQLHLARRGGKSAWLTAGMEQTIVEAGRALLSSGDFCLCKLVRGEQFIAGALFARAGEVSELLLTAFDPGWSNLAPGQSVVVAGIERQLDNGARLIDFGFGGERKYLERLSNGTHPVAWWELFPTNRKMPLARARWIRGHSLERVSIWRGQLRLRQRLRGLRHPSSDGPGDTSSRTG